MEKKLDLLYSAVVGNELTDEGGFKQFYKDHEKRITDLENKQESANFFNKNLLAIWGTVCFIGAIIYGLADLYLKFKGK